jgi:hypothetical protein
VLGSAYCLDVDQEERRRRERHRICFPIQLNGRQKQGRIGLCRNGSATGMLLGTPSRFELGERLELDFRVTSKAEDRRVAGTIVRVDEEKPNRDHWCHRLIAIVFDEEQPDLADVFAELAPHQARIFGLV